MSRLESFDSTGGIDSPEEVLGPITPGEAATFGLAAGQIIPMRMASVIRRSLSASLEELIIRGFISWKWALSRVIKQIDPSGDSFRSQDDRRRLVGAVRLMKGASADGPISCPRCGRSIAARRFVCDSCIASLARLRQAANGYMVMGVGGAVAIGYFLTVALRRIGFSPFSAAPSA